MKVIYKSAETVIVWLVEEKDGDEAAVELLQTFESEAGSDGYDKDIYVPNFLSYGSPFHTYMGRATESFINSFFLDGHGSGGFE